MQITVLGALAVDGRAVRGQRLGDLVRALVDARGRVVLHASLVESVWQGEPPLDENGALQALVARARRAGLAVVTTTEGYRLPLDGLTVDVVEVEALLARGRRELRAGSPHPALAAARDARALLDDRPGSEDVAGPGPVTPDATRRTRLLADVVALLTEAALATGDVDELGALEDLRTLAMRTPPDEPLVALLVRALAAQGRDAEALHVIDRLRSELAEHYGTDPSPVVSAVHVALLRGELSRGRPAAHRARPSAGPSMGTSPTGTASSGTGADAPPPAPRGAPAPATWHRALTTLVGRDDDLERIEDTLAREPLVTLVAVGGAGKTRLALEAARRAADGGEDVHVVELAGLRGDAEVLPALLGALGASESTADMDMPQGRRLLTPEDRLRGAVAELSGLLVLDNCEHVLDGAAATVAGLLAVASPGLRVLATSRAALGVAGETVHLVRALPDDLAVGLLESRARAGRPELAWDPAVALELCRRLDHLPLAIELAAARLRTMPLDDVLAGVVDRFGLLDDALRGLPDQHAGLWAMVDWSWTLLAPEERVLLAGLSVFPAPFTAEAATATADPGAPSAVRRRLANLVDHSLLALEDTGEAGGAARYRMLETVREYGAARIGSGAQRTATMRRLVTWAADEAHAHGGRLGGAEQLEALAALAADQETLVEALRSAIADDDDRAAFAIGSALMLAWTIRGLHAEALTWGRQVLRADSAARGPSLRARSLPGTTGTTSGADPAPDDVATVALLSMLSSGIASDLRALALGRRAAARTLAEHPDRLSRGLRALLGATRVKVWLDPSALLPVAGTLIDDPDPLVNALGHLMRSVGQENQGEIAAALEDARAAFALFEGSGNRWGMAMAAQGLGQWQGAGVDGDSDDWLTIAQENFELVGATQDARSIAVDRYVNAAVHGDAAVRGDLEEVLASRAHDASARAHALGGLAALDAVDGRWDDAIAHADAAADLTRDAPSTAPQARILYQGGAAVMRIRSGRADAVRDAATLLARALPDALATRDVPLVSTIGLGYAELAAYRGETEHARELWALAMRLGSHATALFGTPTGRLALALGDTGSRAALRAWAGALTGTEATARITALLGAEDRTVAPVESSGT